jgi:predicted AAA+ superfamily ATPase
VVSHFDLESSEDLARLEDPLLTLRPLKGLVVIDEVQRRPDLFQSLRVLVDEPGAGRRYLVLGSASPHLLRQSSETLAGRIAYHVLPGLFAEEVGANDADRLWRRGGFPRSFLGRSEAESFRWRQEMVKTYLERDLPGLGLRLPAPNLRRFWTMLAHYHGQVWNGSELGRAFGISHTTVRRYLDLLVETYMARVLPPWFENIGKRQVRAPKVYIEDTGLLHTLLGIRDAEGLESHPKVGASWEGFVLKEVVARFGAAPEECFFWATHSGAELDLLIVRGRSRLGVEVKRTTAPSLTHSMKAALADLELERILVVHGGRNSFDLAPRVRAVAFAELASEFRPSPLS